MKGYSPKSIKNNPDRYIAGNNIFINRVLKWSDKQIIWA